MSRRYVETSAVRGRESEVLDALGIAWRDGRPHIRCPYPDHDDAHPSWRFDAVAGRAFCTCLQRENGRSHSIFDVVMRMHRSDFGAAAAFVSRVLSNDPPRQGVRAAQLIQTSGGDFFSPEALLTPPPEQRSDALVKAYLAHRLGMAPELAPLPSTRIAGWRACPYFDPPAHDGDSPIRIGAFPCAVFETVAADGRRHAQRIYLESNGSGKAVLGFRSDGTRRDPKKSATRRDRRAKTAGCAALFGDPESAAHVVVAEGVETAAALAYAFMDEIAGGEMLVAAAISSAGLAAFEPWPACRRLTIAADRDEAAKPNGSPGSRAGEKAARRLSRGLCERLSVAIALPGQPGESVDFLDVLRGETA